MGTRSTIALEFADGTVQTVYCHWDGYLDNNGKILKEHYSNPFKLRDLINLGDISSLGPELGEKHDFDCPFKYTDPKFREWQKERNKVTTFYGRDRGETNIDAEEYEDYSDYVEIHGYQEYDYILRSNGKWYVSIHADQYIELDEAFERDMDAEAE